MEGRCHTSRHCAGLRWQRMPSWTRGGCPEHSSGTGLSVRRTPTLRGRWRGGTAGAGGRLFTAHPLRRPGCCLSQVWRLLKQSPDIIRLCEERRWISRFLGVGRVDSAVTFVLCFSLVAVGLDVRLSAPRPGAVGVFLRSRSLTWSAAKRCRALTLFAKAIAVYVTDD